MGYSPGGCKELDTTEPLRSQVEYMAKFKPQLLTDSYKESKDFLEAQIVKNLPATGDLGLIAGQGRSPGEGNGNPLQYSCLENPTARGAWQATVHAVTESDVTERLTLLL